jgi:hypothetical protein
VDFSSAPNVDALLVEELTSDEVQELLERLNVRDFGGSENPTVGAIVEATGSDPVTVGRLLAEIRKEDFEERFGLHLKHQDRRIESLEERAKRLESSSRSYRRGAFQRPREDPYEKKALDRLVQEERKREEDRPIAIVLSIIIGLIFIILAAGQCSPEANSSVFPARMSVDTVNGGWIEETSPGNIRVREKDGTTRAATEEEISKYVSIAALGQSRNR